MFFCEFYEIPRNTFFTEHLWGTAFERYLLTSIKRSKVHEKNISRERAWNFDQWKKFSENYKAEFGYGLFAKLPKIIVAHEFWPNSLKL